MNRYKCHKEVSAMKIQYCTFFYNSEFRRYDFRIVGENDEFVEVTREFMDKHHVTPGSYYVVYDDGYASVSPKKAFEERYTQIASA